MSSASPPLQPTASARGAADGLERRLRAEWDLLRRFAERNPLRLTEITAEDLSFSLCLRQTPGLALPQAGDADQVHVVTDHEVRVQFPRFFPTAPLELYLRTPMQHPNIHPQTGFVCLWEKHRVSHTVEHALHKLAAMLGWRLHNAHAVHVMQPEALAKLAAFPPGIGACLEAPPLMGIVHESAAGSNLCAREDGVRRMRLS